MASNSIYSDADAKWELQNLYLSVICRLFIELEYVWELRFVIDIASFLNKYKFVSISSFNYYSVNIPKCNELSEFIFLIFEYNHDNICCII